MRRNTQTIRAMLAVLILLAIVPATKARPTMHQNVDTHSAERGPRGGAGGGFNGWSSFYSEMRRNYEAMSAPSMGQCAIATTLDSSSSSDEDAGGSGSESAAQKRRRRRSASPAASAVTEEEHATDSEQAHTDDATTSEHEAAASVVSTSSDAGDVAVMHTTTYLITNFAAHSQAPFRSNYALRKRGHRVFLGQLYKEVSPVLLSGMLGVLFPQWTHGVDVDMECHTNPRQPGRGKGCAWVWTSTEEQQKQLLAVNKEVLIDVDASGMYMQLVVTDKLMALLPHLAPVSEALHPSVQSTQLESFAAQRRQSMAQPGLEWLLPSGPVTVELPSGGGGSVRTPSRQHQQRSVASVGNRVVAVHAVTTYRHNPYDATFAKTVLSAASAW